MADATVAGSPRSMQQIWIGVGAMFQVVGRAFVVNATAEARLRQVQVMQSLSDAELARMGVERDKIAQHVFRDLFVI